MSKPDPDTLEIFDEQEFDIKKLTVVELRKVLFKYEIAFNPSWKKGQLLAKFMLDLRPKGPQIVTFLESVEPCSDGIIDADPGIDGSGKT